MRATSWNFPYKPIRFDSIILEPEARGDLNDLRT